MITAPTVRLQPPRMLGGGAAPKVVAAAAPAPRVLSCPHPMRRRLPQQHGTQQSMGRHSSFLKGQRGGVAAASGVRPHVSPSSSADVDYLEILVGDDFKEEDRKKLRTVFDFELWKRHRGSGRYWRHFTAMFQSRMIRWMGAPLAYVVGIATAVALYHTAADVGLVPAVLPELKGASSAPFGLTSFALSTLLVLRTNASYGRWDEARKMWGLIVNRSRDITRMGLTYIPSSRPELQNMFCRWMAAYSWSLMCHLRPDEDLEARLLDKMRPDELRALLSAAHKPNYVMQVLAAIIRAGQHCGSPISDNVVNMRATAAYRMDENLTVFADVTGGCERILRTPIPLLYTRHNSRFLIIWLTLLPFTLWDTCHWAMVPIAAIVAFLLLGIKEIGVSIEEPFSILPLEAICDTIEKNIWELHRMHSAGSVMQQHQAGFGEVHAAAMVNAIVPVPDLSSRTSLLSERV